MRTRIAYLVAATILAASGVVTATPYPVDEDGTYAANVIRHFGPSGALLTQRTVISPEGYQLEGDSPPGNAMVPLWWHLPQGDASAGAVVRFTLDRAYPIKKFTHVYGQRPDLYEIRLSDTGFDSMRTVVGMRAVTGDVTTDVLAQPMRARYIEYRWFGADKRRAEVLLKDFLAYAGASGTDKKLQSWGGFDVVELGQASLADLTPSKWREPLPRSLDGRLHENSFRGNGSGDAKFRLDLKDVHPICAVTLGFAPRETWSSGAKVEVSADGLNYKTVFDRAGSLGTSLLTISLAPTRARYIRVTNYNGDGGELQSLEVFAVDFTHGQTWNVGGSIEVVTGLYIPYIPFNPGARPAGGSTPDAGSQSESPVNPSEEPVVGKVGLGRVPEPATVVVLAVGALGLLRRRRRCE